MTSRQTLVVDLGTVEGEGGVVWSVSPGGFHTNLVVLRAGDSIAAHRNDSLHVLVVVLAGSATVTIDGAPSELGAAGALLIPLGAVREITAGPDGVRYLTVHSQALPLTITRSPA